MSAVVVPTLALTRSEVRVLMRPADYLEAVEMGFRAHRSGSASVPPPLGLELGNGGFHAKVAALSASGRNYVALKFNANFPDNPERNRLPTIQGAILLCDGDSGALLALMDSTELTLKRTAAATALAARHLARPKSETVLVCGCGDQAPAQLEALLAVLPLRRGFCWDRDPERSAAFARKFRNGFVTAAHDLADAAQQSDVIVTCMTATEPFLTVDMVRAGTFIAAVGADNPRKSEIDPTLMAKALVVTDSTDQCATMGDLHHAIEAGVMAAADVHSELAEFVAGTTPGRTNEARITLFDSTGVAVQDAASAVRIYLRALEARAPTRIALAA
jgi:ornithine cyclodeaminase/alanine dehydrogenase-like protein (mu-crystallin family)